MIVALERELELHLRVLSKLCRKSIYPKTKEVLLKSSNILGIKKIFEEME